jgi:PBSX family phage terminase large subunit
MSQNPELTPELKNLVDNLSPIDIRAELFKKGNFDFIVTGKDENEQLATHIKQREALEILRANKYEEFLYGGAAGGAKSVTGAVWLLFMCLIYPGTRYFVARNELKDILDSVFVTFKLICRWYGFTGYKYNAVKNFIQFDNGSYINFIEIKYKPSDPMFEDLGSTEYTCGWMEEIGESHHQAYVVLRTRIGRYMNKEYGIKKMMFMTCNPKKNWAKLEFYDKDKNNTLESHKYYLQCLITENPFLTADYVNSMRRLAEEDKATFERLFKGNWDYEENPNALCEYEMIEQIYDNDHVVEGKKYLTADVARYGSDKAVILVWNGWQVIEKVVYDISKTTDIENTIQILRRKHQIPKNRAIADQDGVGGGVVDGTGILGFGNNERAIKEAGEQPNYRNLQIQCLYHLADKVNEGGLWINCDMSYKEKEQIKEELDQIQSKNSNERKLDCKSKEEIKQDIGRSPDYRDALLMRVFFDLKPIRRNLVSSRKRTTL